MSRPADAADVAVVGAGITGLSIAWHAASRGLRVVIFDGRGVGSGATALQPGGMRQQWGTRASCLMAREAYEFYVDFEARLSPSVDPGFDACGYLFVAHTQETLARQAEQVALQVELGIPSRVVTVDEMHELVEGLDTTALIGGAYCDRDGYFDRPQAVVAGFADAAWRSGATLIDQHVRELVPARPGWRLRLDDGSDMLAEQVVVAAACDSTGLLAPLGVEVPITKEPRYLFYSDPIRERLLEPLVVAPDRHFAAKQLADGSVLASDLAATGEPEDRRDDWHRHVRRTISEMLPILEYVSFPTTVEGFYDVTPDRQPIIGAVGRLEGMWLASGLNGRGLMMAPAVGRVLADALTGRPAESWIDTFSLQRFASGALVQEAQVV
jgi:sarcosine oxidase subunit beta